MLERIGLKLNSRKPCVFYLLKELHGEWERIYTVDTLKYRDMNFCRLVSTWGLGLKPLHLCTNVSFNNEYSRYLDDEINLLTLAGS